MQTYQLNKMNRLRLLLSPLFKACKKSSIDSVTSTTTVGNLLAYSTAFIAN